MIGLSTLLALSGLWRVWRDQQQAEPPPRLVSLPEVQAAVPFHVLQATYVPSDCELQEQYAISGRGAPTTPAILRPRWRDGPRDELQVALQGRASARRRVDAVIDGPGSHSGDQDLTIQGEGFGTRFDAQFAFERAGQQPILG